MKRFALAILILLSACTTREHDSGSGTFLVKGHIVSIDEAPPDAPQSSNMEVVPFAVKLDHVIVLAGSFSASRATFILQIAHLPDYRNDVEVYVLGRWTSTKFTVIGWQYEWDGLCLTREEVSLYKLPTTIDHLRQDSRVHWRPNCAWQ